MWCMKGSQQIKEQKISVQCWATETDTIMKCGSWKDAAESEAATMTPALFPSLKKETEMLKM